MEFQMFSDVSICGSTTTAITSSGKVLCVGKYLRIYGSDDTLYTRRSQEYRTYFRADHKNSNLVRQDIQY